MYAANDARPGLRQAIARVNRVFRDKRGAWSSITSVSPINSKGPRQLHESGGQGDPTYDTGRPRGDARKAWHRRRHAACRRRCKVVAAHDSLAILPRCAGLALAQCHASTVQAACRLLVQLCLLIFFANPLAVCCDRSGHRLWLLPQQDGHRCGAHLTLRWTCSSFSETHSRCSTDMAVLREKYDALKGSPSSESSNRERRSRNLGDMTTARTMPARNTDAARIAGRVLQFSMSRGTPLAANVKAFTMPVLRARGQEGAGHPIRYTYFRSALRRVQKRSRAVGGAYFSERRSIGDNARKAQWRLLEEELRKPAEVRLVASSIHFVAEFRAEAWRICRTKSSGCSTSSPRRKRKECFSLGRSNGPSCRK